LRFDATKSSGVPLTPSTCPPKVPMNSYPFINEAPMTADNNYKICPDCAEQVRAAARLCRFCGFSFLTGQSGLRPNSAGALTPLEGSPEEAGALAPVLAPVLETEVGEQASTSDEESPAGQTSAADRLAGWRAVEGAPGTRLPTLPVATLLERGDDRLPPQIPPAPEETEIITTPDSPPSPEPLEDGPVVLERLPTLPVVPEKGPFGFALPTLAFIALIAAGIVFYLLVISPAAPPVPSASPTSASRSFVPPTPGPLEIAASYQSFVGDADTFYRQSTPLYTQLQAEIANGANTSATIGSLVTNFQTLSDTLVTITPSACFETLYQQMVSLNSRALGDAQALAAAGAGTDLTPLAASLGSDLDSWQTFISAQLTAPRCGAVAATSSPTGSSSSSTPSISSTP
jgi:hypothetical protein